LITILDPRALQNAVLGINGVRQNATGTVIEYWRGKPDFDPDSKRKSMFEMARKMHDAGLCRLVQVKGDVVEVSPMGAELGDIHEYSYRLVVN
jgi:hypothetical protein